MSNPAVFLDRDGTLIEDYEYLTDPNDVELKPGVASAMRLLRDRGFTLIMVTNQSAVARGYLTEQQLQEIHDTLKMQLAEKSVYLDGMYYCPYHPEGVVEKYRQESDLRKPNPGMLAMAAEEMGIDLTQSWMVGDADRDVEAGRAAGCRTIFLESYGAAGGEATEVKPDHKAQNLQEAANLIARFASPGKTGDNVPPETDTTTTHLVDTKNVVPETAESDSPAEPLLRKGTRPVRVKPELEPIETPLQTETNMPVESPPSPATPAPMKDRSISKAAPRRTETPSGDQLLSQILREIQTSNRQQSFSEFSIFKLLAGVAQMIVLFFMILAIWQGSGAEPQTLQVHTSLLWGGLFQLMTLTLLVMHKH